MPEIHVYTSFSYAYLSRARILAQSLRAVHPDWVLWAVIVDRPPPTFTDRDWEADFDRILDPAILYDNWADYIFRHDVVEACTAVKGRAMAHILAEGADKVLYFDPDIAIFHSLNGLTDRLDRASIILTPHQVTANESDADFRENELVSLKYGIYNLGFIGVRNDENGRALAAWWASCLDRACYDKIEDGIFTDQKYCDLIPALFDGVEIVRDPGYNVASWNISKRVVSISRSGEIHVNDDLLHFYHFTKINSDGEGMTRKFARRNYSVFEIWNWYKRRLRDLDPKGVPYRYWHYGSLADGTPIPKRIREFYRENLDLFQTDDPFSTAPGSFADRYRRAGTGMAPEADKVVPLRPTDGETPPVACVIHAYYPELLAEIVEPLSRYEKPLKIFLTVPPDRSDRAREVISAFRVDFEIFELPNRGRDMFPFLAVLPHIFAQGYDYVLKLHTKKSLHLDHGDAWRQELISSFASPEELAATVKAFIEHPGIGIIGPAGHLLSMQGYMGSNQGHLNFLLGRLGVGDLRPVPPAFVAGSMFMARREALEPVVHLGLRLEEFEPEAGQTDGTLAHAVERALTYAAGSRLLTIAGKAPASVGGVASLSTAFETAYAYAPRSHVITDAAE